MEQNGPGTSMKLVCADSFYLNIYLSMLEFVKSNMQGAFQGVDFEREDVLPDRCMF